MMPCLRTVTTRPLWQFSLLLTSLIERSVLVRAVRLSPLRARPHCCPLFASPSAGVVELAPQPTRLSLLRSCNPWQSFPDSLESP